MHPYTRRFILPSPPDADNDVTENYEIGDVVHVTGGSIYDCRDATEGAAVWEERTGGGGSYTDEEAQDAVGAMLDTTLEYVDATPLLRRAALTGEVTAPAGSNSTTVTNASVIAKVLTAFAAGAGVVSSADSILTAFQKVVGNIALKLTANSPITGATKTKITYDANGLVTAGADIGASDLPSGIDAAKISAGTVSNTEFDFLNGVTSGIQTQIDAKEMAAQIHAAGSTPFSGNDDNEIGFWDFATGLLKKDTWQTIVLDIQNLFMSVFADGAAFTLHTHDAGTTPKLIQANTHQSPDTDTGTSSLHHTIGTGANQAAAGTRGVTNGDTHDHVGGDGAPIKYREILPAHGLNGTIAAGVTSHTPLFFYGLNAAAFVFTAPRAGTLKNLSMWNNTAQPATGSLVVTVLKNGAASALTFTYVNADGVVYKQDTTHTVSVVAGDTISIRHVNNATGASAQINGLTLEFEMETT